MVSEEIRLLAVSKSEKKFEEQGSAVDNGLSETIFERVNESRSGKCIVASTVFELELEAELEIA